MESDRAVHLWPLVRRVAVTTFMLLLAGGSAAAGNAAEPTVAGYTTVRVPGDTVLRGGASNTLSVVVWYPAAAGASLAQIAVGPPEAPYFREGLAAKDAPIAPSPERLPLIVVSHGTGGTAMDLAWLCAGLAAHGYIVAAVNHPGNNALEPPTVAGSSLYWLRANDLSRTLDGIFAISRFGARIDPARIGAAGISLGGYTVLEIAGARTDAEQSVLYCASKPQTPICSGLAAPAIPNLAAKGRALAAVDSPYRAAVATQSASYRDVRVKAIFAIEPAEGPAIVPASLTGISVPVALVAGLGDVILPVSDNVIPDALAIPNAQLTLDPKPVGHDTFLMDCTAAGEAAYPAICTDAGPSRLAVHAATLDLARSFFGRTLGN